jgi:hypothetical protein
MLARSLARCRILYSFSVFWFTGLVLFGVLPCGQRFREDAMHEDNMSEDL